MEINNILLSLVHPNIGNSIGEKVFTAMLTSIAISIVLIYLNKRKAKKQEVETNKSKLITQEVAYKNSLKNIVGESVVDSENILLDSEDIKKQLLKGCNPKNFIDPYDAQKLEIAKTLYTQLNTKLSDSSLSLIWEKAEKELGIVLDANDLYTQLEKIYNPANYVDDNFDEVKLSTAVKAYKYIQENKHNLRNLIMFAKSAGLLRQNGGGPIIPIVCDFDLSNTMQGNIVCVCGLYPMEFVGIYDDAYCFYPLDENRLYMEEGDLGGYLKIDNQSHNYLRIPITNCERVKPSEVTIIK